MSQEQLTGSSILAKSLKSLGVDVIFGIVGVPVVEVIFY
jgi:thiamine pyrophosphate-dependent acetolactate synthase large subunit-like protein